MDSAWKRIVARFADGRQLCNCGQAYYSEGEGLNKGHMICRYGCEANILLTRDKLAEKIEALLTHADARQEGYREGAEDACKLRCDFCKEGYPLTPKGRHHQVGDYQLPCKATDIRALTQARGEGELNKGETMFKNYRKKNVQPMRPYVPGEDLNGVSVNPEDTPELGGMIAHNPEDPKDQWYVAKKFFEDNYVEV